MKQRIEWNGIRVPHEPGVDADAEAMERAKREIRRALGQTPWEMKIAKKSIDTRRGIAFVYTVSAEVDRIPAGAEKNHASLRICPEPAVERIHGTEPLTHRPVIVGFGPAGMFAGLLLAEEGYAPLILERGGAVEERTAAVERFIRDGILDERTNIQFGAGGAGTFSDGKLTTRIGDPLVAWVMRTLADLGAPEDILYKSKPHIGTDILREVVKNADRRIRSLGGEIRYNTRASHITASALEAEGETIPFDALVLATGHSARDTVGELIDGGYSVAAKPFSVGVRAEHLQRDIDEALFHEHAGDPAIGKGEYQLSWRQGERGCYTFCMCPGGTVVPSASETGGVVTNGMSVRARDGMNANAAVCVSVLPTDFGGSPREAIAFQRDLERAAFRLGGGDYSAPCQTVGDFLAGRYGTECTKILPTYRGGRVAMRDLSSILPPFVTQMLRAGLADFGKKLRGYDDPSVPLTGVETRTSSPVRILRTEDGCAVGHPGIYPCGEGAGYAGGIVSAAVDGVRTAQKIMKNRAPAKTAG